MPDREKVIKGLEYCAEWHDCKACPYFSLMYFENVDGEYNGYKCKCLADALALLKEQEEQLNIKTENFNRLVAKVEVMPKITQCKD